MKPIKTWVLIADGARARVLLNEGPGNGLHPVDDHEFRGDHSSTHDLVSDREGRGVSSGAGRHSAMPSHSDPHRELKRGFAHELAGVLAAGLNAKSYDRLVIVAAPATLGDLRAAISSPVRATVAGEIAQDLTKNPNSEIAAHLKDVLTA